jgi:hypothetical protein
VSLNDILEHEAISQHWELAAAGHWKCAVGVAEVVRHIRPMHMKKIRGIYLQFLPDAVYVGKASYFSRARVQARKKFISARFVAFIWNERVFGDGGMTSHIEAALTNAYLHTGRQVTNKVASVHSRDAVRMHMASKFLRDVLLSPGSKIAELLGFHEDWAKKTVDLYASMLMEAGVNVRRYKGAYQPDCTRPQQPHAVFLSAEQE